MRCPKCGFISFDHLEVCLKCKKDIKVASEALQGGVLHVASPTFLNLHPESEESQLDEGELVVDDGEVVEEYVDPDLDVLFEDEAVEGEIDGLSLEAERDDFADLEISMDDGGEDEIALELSADEEIAIDLGQDEDEIAVDLDGSGNDAEIEEHVFDSEPNSEIEKGDVEFEIEMPEELIDMSDLAPPVSSEDSDPSTADSSADPDSLDINLDNFDFELESDTPGSKESADIAGGGETVLSLDDIDFSDTVGSPKKKSGKKTAEMDMDEDLNFDLDLGGLSIHDKNL